jgi:hypothetical protein
VQNSSMETTIIFFASRVCVPFIVYDHPLHLHCSSRDVQQAILYQELQCVSFLKQI